MSLAIGLLVAWVARWAGAECVEAARCKRLGCQECSYLVPCDEALHRLLNRLPQARIHQRKT